MGSRCFIFPASRTCRVFSPSLSLSFHLSVTSRLFGSQRRQCGERPRQFPFDCRLFISSFSFFDLNSLRDSSQSSHVSPRLSGPVFFFFFFVLFLFLFWFGLVRFGLIKK